MSDPTMAEIARLLYDIRDNLLARVERAERKLAEARQEIKRLKASGDEARRRYNREAKQRERERKRQLEQ